MKHNSHHGHFEAPREKRRLTGKQKGIIGIVLALAVLAGVATGIYKTLVKPPEKPQPVQEETQDANTQPEPEVKKPTIKHVVTKVDEQTGEEVEEETELPASHQTGVYNILICGTDDDGYRTDTIIVAHLNETTHDVALMSVPRDTVVLNGSGGIMKINSVYAGGGADGMARLSKRLGAMLGFELDGYVLVNLKAFRETVNLVGGVEFDVPQDMYYNDPSQDLYINLKAGKQTLDGEKAMELVRFRKGYASQDIQRTKVQQEFLRALAKKVLSVSSLTKLKDFADVFSTYVTTDLTVGNMLYFAQALMKCDFDSMKTYTLEGEGAMINGGSYYPLYAGKLVQVVNESFNPYDAPVTLDTVNVITPDLARSYQKQTAPEPEEPENPEEQTPENPDEEAPEDPDAENPDNAENPDETPPENPEDTQPGEPEIPGQLARRGKSLAERTADGADALRRKEEKHDFSKRGGGNRRKGTRQQARQGYQPD